MQQLLVKRILYNASSHAVQSNNFLIEGKVHPIKNDEVCFKCVKIFNKHVVLISLGLSSLAAQEEYKPVCLTF